MVEGEKRSYLKYVTSKKGKNREKEEDGNVAYIQSAAKSKDIHCCSIIDIQY